MKRVSENKVLAVALLLLTQTPSDPLPLMNSLLQRDNLPAIGLCKVTLTGGPQIWVAGVRKKGESDPVQSTDLWHLGSDTKAFTAALVAAVAQRKGKSLNNKVANELNIPNPDPTHREVTINQLLDMKANLIADPVQGWYFYQSQPGSDVQRRRQVAIDFLTAPGELHDNKESYSNAGYVIAGSLVETWTREPYETAMEEMLLKPLGLESATFDMDLTNQPRPHKDGKPIEGNGIDNPKVMAPAGELRISLADWATWCREVMKSIRGDDSLMPKTYGESIRGASASGGYVCGWRKLTRSWSRGPVYAHSGSNTMNYCTAFLAPAEGVAYLATTNDGGKNAQPALDLLISYLIDPNAIR